MNETLGKHKYQIITAVAMAIVGVGLIIAGFVVKPTGEIHPSVLTALGELLTFSGSLFGIDAHYKMKTESHELESNSNSKKEE